MDSISVCLAKATTGYPSTGCARGNKPISAISAVGNFFFFFREAFSGVCLSSAFSLASYWAFPPPTKPARPSFFFSSTVSVRSVCADGRGTQLVAGSRERRRRRTLFEEAFPPPQGPPPSTSSSSSSSSSSFRPCKVCARSPPLQQQCLALPLEAWAPSRPPAKEEKEEEGPLPLSSLSLPLLSPSPLESGQPLPSPPPFPPSPAFYMGPSPEMAAGECHAYILNVLD